MLRRGLTCCLLLAAARAWADGAPAPLATAPQAPRVTTVDRPEALAPLLAVTDGKRQTDVIWLKLAAAQFDDAAAQALRNWVADGGTVWTETDAAALFGFRVAAPTDRELIGHAKRAGALLASNFTAQVDDVFYSLQRGAAFVTAHDSAVPLLRVMDQTVRPSFKLVAAELDYGDGQVIHRPGDIQLARGEGKAFDTSLKLLSGTHPDEVIVPVDSLMMARQRCVDALAAFPDAAKAKDQLLNVFLAYRLWWAQHLTRTGRYEDAWQQLKAVAADAQTDPAVYLAVVRWNERQGRVEPARQARVLAQAAYDKVGRQMPGPISHQVRVPWDTFVEGVNLAGAVWDKPVQDQAAALLARTDNLLALDSYHRGDLVAAEKLWQEARQGLAGWAEPSWWLGLTYQTLGDDLRASSRQRAAWYHIADQFFTEATKPSATQAFDTNHIVAAKAWHDAAAVAAAKANREPPDVLVRGNFIYRWDSTDRALNTGPQMSVFQSVLEQSYQTAEAFGVWLEPTEVLICPDANTMAGLLPATGASRQAFGASATAGRRIFVLSQPTNTERQCGHEFMHVLCNALTQGGFPPPQWYEEGLCALAEHDTFQRQLATANLRRGRALTLQQINDPGVMFDRNVMDMAFGQAQLMVDSLLRRWGQGSVVPFLMNLGWGIEPDKAFGQMTNLSQEQFMTAFLAGRL
jgi:hypothetical protein